MNAVKSSNFNVFGRNSPLANRRFTIPDNVKQQIYGMEEVLKIHCLADGTVEAQFYFLNGKALRQNASPLFSCSTSTFTTKWSNKLWHDGLGQTSSSTLIHMLPKDLAI